MAEMADMAKMAAMAELAEMAEEAWRAEIAELVQLKQCSGSLLSFCCNAIILTKKDRAAVAATAPASNHTLNC